MTPDAVRASTVVVPPLTVRPPDIATAPGPKFCAAVKLFVPVTVCPVSVVIISAARQPTQPPDVIVIPSAKVAAPLTLKAPAPAAANVTTPFAPSVPYTNRLAGVPEVPTVTSPNKAEVSPTCNSPPIPRPPESISEGTRTEGVPDPARLLIAISEFPNTVTNVMSQTSGPPVTPNLIVPFVVARFGVESIAPVPSPTGLVMDKVLGLAVDACICHSWLPAPAHIYNDGAPPEAAPSIFTSDPALTWNTGLELLSCTSRMSVACSAASLIVTFLVKNASVADSEAKGGAGEKLTPGVRALVYERVQRFGPIVIIIALEVPGPAW